MMTKKPLALLSTLGAAWLSACTPAQPVQTPQSPAPTTTTEPVAAPEVATDPWLVTDLLREEQLPLLKGPAPTFNEAKLEAPVKGVPAAPASCDAFTKRAAKAKPTCADKASSLAALDAAFATADAAQRDELLVAAESCAGLEPGFVRALRVEMAPIECGDVLAEPVLKAKPAGMSGAVQHTLVGHAIAARLARSVGTPPKLKGPFDKKKVIDFTKTTLFPWFDEQRKAVEQLSSQGRELASYGKGLVALQSGWAYLRLVEVVRDAPIPEEFRKDPDLANAYFAAVDEKLDPTKDNGRDGALVGLGMMAQAGVLNDERMRTTRALLAKMYGGRRVDALDVLALPRIADAESGTVELRLAAKLPPYLAGLVLDPKSATDPKMLRSLLHKGVSMPMRALLKEAEGTLSDEARALYARARVEMGVRYWRTVDFDTAVSLLSKIPKDKLDATAKVVLAAAIALRSGPEDVSILMRKEGGFSPQFADVRALDEVAKTATEPGHAGLAAFDAAVLRQIAAPRDADAKYWEGLAERYKDAAAKLAEGPVKHEADERVKAAVQTAKILKSTMP